MLTWNNGDILRCHVSQRAAVALRPHCSQRFYSQPTIRLSSPRIMAVDSGCEGQSQPSICLDGGVGSTFQKQREGLCYKQLAESRAKQSMSKAMLAVGIF
ncbi:hypothetical protein ACE6H2_017877 [Prunus campanulata]